MICSRCEDLHFYSGQRRTSTEDHLKEYVAIIFLMGIAWRFFVHTSKIVVLVRKECRNLPENVIDRKSTKFRFDLDGQHTF